MYDNTTFSNLSSFREPQLLKRHASCSKFSKAPDVKLDHTEEKFCLSLESDWIPKRKNFQVAHIEDINIVLSSEFGIQNFLKLVSTITQSSRN